MPFRSLVAGVGMCTEYRQEEPWGPMARIASLVNRHV